MKINQKKILFIFGLSLIGFSYPAIAQKSGYIPDAKTLRTIEIAEKNYIVKRDNLHRCAWEQIAILSKANESADITARGAKSMCSKLWVVASDAFGDLINAQFSASDGKRITNYKETFDEQMFEDFRALVMRYRGLTR
jgi:hypothetical protein